jgi:hypothetical protein
MVIAGAKVLTPHKLVRHSFAWSLDALSVDHLTNIQSDLKPRDADPPDYKRSSQADLQMAPYMVA